tara:strand:- start:497 stop:706 length:210 start_codon:yes stop_codon:yes gene_type:complete
MKHKITNIYVKIRWKMMEYRKILLKAQIKKIENAMNQLDNCIDDCSQETADAISKVYSAIDKLKKGFHI